MSLKRTFITLGWKFWASEVIMVVFGVYNFTVSAQQWGYGNANATISQGGLLSAATLELGLIVFLHLARFAFFARQRTWQTLVGFFAWALISLALAFISLHNNQLYSQAHWRPEDGDVTTELWTRCIVPMAVMFFCCIVPPGKLIVRSQEEIDREYDAKIHEARREQELALVRTQDRQDRRAQAARERAIHTQLLRIARQEGMDTASYQVENDGSLETDWISLEADLAARGKWDSEHQRPLATVQAEPGDEPPNVITDGLLPSLSLSSPAKALPAG